MKEKKYIYKTDKWQQSKAPDKGPHREDVMSQMGFGFMIAYEYLKSAFGKNRPQKKFQWWNTHFKFSEKSLKPHHL